MFHLPTLMVEINIEKSMNTTSSYNMCTPMLVYMVLTDDNYNSSIDRYQNLREMELKLIQPLLVAIQILNLHST